MSLPGVNQTELDGALGVLPPSSGDLLAVVGCSSSGPLNTPATYARVSDLVNDFGVGPLVEAAARHIDVTGSPVCVVRCDKTTDGASGVPAITNPSGTTGTSIPTADATLKPLDDYEVYFLVVAGGTVGTAGITFQYSLDGGRTLSPVQALGAANTWTDPGGSGVKIDFAAGTLLANDLVQYRTTAPAPNATQLTAAIDALRTTAISWKICEIATPIDATLFDAIEAEFANIFGIGRMRMWIGSARTPNVGESESAYLTALTTIFASKATKVGNLCAGSCEIVSGVTRRKYRRPIAFDVASDEASVAEHINVADVTRGPRPGVSITDANGNPKHHDESINPGLDDARFTTLRTWEGRAGVYVTRSRIFSSAGSDFYLTPHRRVMNLARQTTRTYFQERLNKPIVVNAATGFIREEDALEIEAGANARLKAVLGDAPKASAWKVVLSRTDNLLSTRTLNAKTRVTPLAYVEFIQEEDGFLNPALNVQTA